MAGAARAGAVIYVSDLAVQIRFYQTLFNMSVLHRQADYGVLENEDIQLVLRTMPAPVAVSSPPALRQNCAIMLFFSVPSLAWAELKAADLGGELLAQQWSGPGFVMRRGVDPEGNVLQLREWQGNADE